MIAPIAPAAAVARTPASTIANPENTVIVTATERFTGSYSLFQSKRGRRASTNRPNTVTNTATDAGTITARTPDNNPTPNAIESRTPPTSTEGIAIARLKSAFAPSTVRADTGAVYMSHRLLPSSETEAAVVEDMPTKNAIIHGRKAAMSAPTLPPIISGGSIPSADAAAAAMLATSTRTYPMHEFIR